MLGRRCGAVLCPANGNGQDTLQVPHMNDLETVKEHCPYCGELIELLIDCSEFQQTYTEDCQVCCRPMVVVVQLNSDDRFDSADFDIYVELRSEDEA